MNDVRQLYQDLILDHNQHPRNLGLLEDSNRTAEGYNALCGDRVTVHLRVVDDSIADVRFEGGGCAISTASASVMTEAIKHMTVEAARQLAERFTHLLVSSDGAWPVELGKLGAFAGVRDYPIRVKCATLAWHTLRAALDGGSGVVSTEGPDI